MRNDYILIDLFNMYDDIGDNFILSKIGILMRRN